MFKFYSKSAGILLYLQILFWLTDFLLPKCCHDLLYQVCQIKQLSLTRNQADTPETDSLCQSIVFIPITIVPDKLSALLLEPKELYIVPGANHVD